MDWMTKLEAFREDAGMSHADMARLFGVEKQNYNNWRYRNSLPKEFYDRAGQIIGSPQAIADGSAAANVYPASIRGHIPLISYVQAGEWSETIDIYQPGYAEQAYPTTIPHSPSTFALKVEGDSMTRPVGVHGRSFPNGMIIFVDPERHAETGDYVVARHNGHQKATFKQLAMEEGRPVLVPLNPDRQQYPVIRDEFEVIGRVIDASWGGV